METLKDIWILFKKLWADNIKKNYKRISVLFGGFASAVISAGVRILCSVIESGQIPIAVGSGLVAMLVALEIFTVGVAIIMFGRAHNGNGYKVPANKDFQVLYKTDDEYKAFTNKKLKELIEKNGG